MPKTQSLRVGLRRETQFLLPAALLLVILISTFTLLAFRGSFSEVVEERKREAVKIATELARAVPHGPRPTATSLRRFAPHAERISVVAPSGRVLVETRPATSAALRLEGGVPQPMAVGLDRRFPNGIAGLAPTLWNERRHITVVELPASVLVRQKRSLTTLTWVVALVDLSLAILVLAFLRHLLKPIDRLLEGARRVGEVLPQETPVEDEVEYLVQAFENAVQALEQRSAQTEPDEIRAFEQMLAPSLDSGLLLLTPEAEVVALNATGAELLGVAPPEAGLPLGEVLSDHADLVDMISAAVEQQQPLHRREIDLDVRGSERPIGLSLHPLRRDGGDVRAHLVLFADLTETRRRAREETLATSLAQVGELAAGVAHEMRNSLATIQGYLTLAERDRSGTQEPTAGYLGDIRRESEQLQRVLEDFLAFARPGSTRLEQIDLQSTVRKAIADPALDGSKTEITSDGELPPILGDRELLVRALRNLLHNASQAQRQAGIDAPIEVAIRRQGDQIAVAVEDRGAGIPESIRDSLFEPFVTERPGGVGLGLSLAHRIVDLHGGSLRFVDRQGGGTRFEIRLPAVSALAQPTE